MQLPQNIEHVEIILPDLPIQFTPSDNPFISMNEILFLLHAALAKKGNMLEIGRAHV